MDIGFDHNSLRGGLQPWPAAASSRDGSALSPDWFGLRARLAAAYLYRRTQADAAVGAVGAGGSFAAAAARTLAACRDGQRYVNPIALGNGKGRAGIHDDAAGAPEPGDRG